MDRQHSPKQSPSLEETEVLLKVNEDRLAFFFNGLENYEFRVHSHPPSYKQLMNVKTFFEHFYGVIQLYVETDTDDLALGRMLVLYGVSCRNSGQSL